MYNRGMEACLYVFERIDNMGKRFDNMLFPGGKSKCFTLSYDDGVIQDKRLVKMLNNYGIKGTFNLGYGVLGYKAEPSGKVNVSKIECHEVEELYRGHEIGGHGLYHSSLSSIGAPLAQYEIVADKKELETLIQRPIKMFAYPFGIYNQSVKEMLKFSGYQGARTVNSTNDFSLPADFLEWNPTCHHNDEKLFELAEKFFNLPNFFSSLFYVWGHAYEFDADDNWDKMESFLKLISSHGKDIWFATNGEIITYVNAYNRLEYSTDGKYIYNPSAIDVWICTSFNQVELLKAGEYTKIKETVL